jgi:hypothetical protein
VHGCQLLNYQENQQNHENSKESIEIKKHHEISRKIKRTPILTINMNNKDSCYEDTRGIYQKSHSKK